MYRDVKIYERVTTLENQKEITDKQLEEVSEEVKSAKNWVVSCTLVIIISVVAILGLKLYGNSNEIEKLRSSINEIKITERRDFEIRDLQNRISELEKDKEENE